MKKKLTLQFLFWNIIILYIVQAVFLGVNLLAIHRGFSFSNNFYNFSFKPEKFSEGYKQKLINNVKGFNLKEEDKKILVDHDIWLQILDNSNKEIYSANKPKEIPIEYLAGDLIEYSSNGWKMPKPSTIYSQTFDKNGQKYSLILGFPIEKIFTKTFVFTEEAVEFYLALIALTFLLTIIAGYLFSRKLVSPVAEVIDNVKLLSQGKYNIKNIKKSGVYKEVNENVQSLAEVLKQNHEKRKEIDKMKEEWIANIAHDLKTPLASVNGYAQFLLNKDYHLENDDVYRYGEIIVSKTEYIQDLINDLSLVYKLKNKVIPLKLEKENIVDIIRESVIDILNNPIYENREINIDYDPEEIYMNCDKKYIKRALNNFIFNALVHNPKDTRIDINISGKSGVLIEIKDNGNGIAKKELECLFDRYYRATNTGESHKGSGLGMAISREIVEVHKGKIEVLSEISKGTRIIMKFL